MGTKKPFLQNTIKKCQVIGCPNEATYYIMANLWDINNIRCGICKDCLSKSCVVKNSQSFIQTLEPVLKGENNEQTNTLQRPGRE